MFVGGLAIGEGFFLMEILGISFMIMGLWIITLGIRYPALDKVFVMHSLEIEFGDDEYGSAYDDEESAVTWTSLAGSSVSRINNDPETKSLIAPER